jgi:IS5 family transposase
MLKQLYAYIRQVLLLTEDAQKLKSEMRDLQTEDGRKRLRERVVVEHALARLSHLGIGQARYFGRAKTRCQLLMACTVANLRRVWNWVADQ